MHVTERRRRGPSRSRSYGAVHGPIPVRLRSANRSVSRCAGTSKVAAISARRIPVHRTAVKTALVRLHASIIIEAFIRPSRRTGC
jgi:hypothetical protein